MARVGAAHGGGWGLARSVRSEAQLPMRCMGASVSSAVGRGGTLTEPEVLLLLHSTTCLVSRLTSMQSMMSMRDASPLFGKGHLVTGGTGGLGLLTGRWLGQEHPR